MSIEKDKYGFIESRDAAHNAGFYCIALHLNGKFEQAKEYITPVKNILMKSIWWPYKHPTYFWEISDGLTLFLSIFFPWVKKGCNADQWEPCLIYFAMTKDYWMLIKFLLGMLLRWGIFVIPTLIYLMFHFNLSYWYLLTLIPFLGWHSSLEPTHHKLGQYGSVFRAFHIKPLYWFCDMWQYLADCVVKYKPITEETTNKVRTYVYLVLAQGQPTYWSKNLEKKFETYYAIEKLTKIEFWKKTFETYWPSSSSKHEIAQIMPYDQIKN